VQLFFFKKYLVCLFWPGYCTPLTHQRDPTTAQRGYFELLDFSPHPIRISSINLAMADSSAMSILTLGLVRTPVQREVMHSRTPDLKPSTNTGLPVAWITELATDSSREKEEKKEYLNVQSLRVHNTRKLAHFLTNRLKIVFTYRELLFSSLSKKGRPSSI